MTDPNSIVATVVGVEKGSLSSGFIDDAVASLVAELGQGTVGWLAEGQAADIFYESKSVENVRRSWTSVLANHPLDIVVQPAASRKKTLLFSDLESTIIQEEMLDEIAEAIGVGEKVAAITKQTMNGEIDFTTAVKERVGLFKGVPLSVLKGLQSKITFMPGAKTLLATMKANGAYCCLISGGFSYFADPVAKQLGFDVCYANVFGLDGEALSGQVQDPILDKNSKAAIVKDVLAHRHLYPAVSLCVGDGANDIPMLSFCNSHYGLGTAFRAKPAVRDVIPHQINHGDLTALLFAQGYKREMFIERV